MAGADLKVCTLCKTSVHGFYTKTKHPDKLFSRCKQCVNSITKERLKKKYWENPEQSRERSRTYHKENRDRINLTKREWCKKNAEVIKATQREWRKNNPELVVVRDKKDYEKRKELKTLYRDLHPEERKVSCKRWREAHKEEIVTANADYYLRNKERIKKRTAEYMKLHPDLYIAAHIKYITKKRGNGGSFTRQEWQDLKQHYDYKCLKCLKTEPEIKLTVDHILPVSKYGSSFISNIQPLCKGCNSSKLNKHIDYRTVQV